LRQKLDRQVQGIYKRDTLCPLLEIDRATLNVILKEMVIMNFLLISTDMEVWALGLRSISAVLKAAGHDTRLVFLPTAKRFVTETILNELVLLASDMDIIGVSCLAQGSDKAKQIIERLRTRKKLILWGGVHASLNPVECAEWADIVCRGEGEEMILELAERLQQGKAWKDIENIAFKKEGVLTLNDLRPPISDLDKLPLPDYSFENEYHLTSKGLVQVYILEDVKVTGRIVFNSSRGCALHCTYCCNVKLKGLYSGGNSYVRRMSVSRLIEHTRALIRRFPQAKNFYFLDEDFGARPLDELKQLAEEFPRKVGIPFECLTHPAQVSREKMDLLVRAGLFRVNMGIESGSERTRREVYDRHVSNKVVNRAAEIISEYPSVDPFYLLIIGNPYEERSDLYTTARFLSGLPPGFNLIIYSLVFFPGSFLYQRAVQDGIIEGTNDSGYELDFFEGLDYKDHPWKRKNLYLNGLLYLMVGSSTRHRIGILPRFLLDSLLNPRLVEFAERHPWGIQVILSSRIFLSKILLQGAQLLTAKSRPVRAGAG
jgi:anaerobic magnesium-protoporphyrin IX monomethyl ester cyclase